MRVSQIACLVQIWWFYLKSVTSHSTDKPNVLEFLVKMAKMTLKVKVNDLHFQYQPRVSQDALIFYHYNDLIMGMIASQITSLTIVYTTIYSDADQRKHQSSASLAFVRGINRGPVNSLHKWPVARKMLPFDDVIMVKISLEFDI